MYYRNYLKNENKKLFKSANPPTLEYLIMTAYDNMKIIYTSI